MTNLETLNQIAADSNVVARKFKLIKTFGNILRRVGVNPSELTANQVESEIRKLLSRH